LIGFLAEGQSLPVLLLLYRTLQVAGTFEITEWTFVISIREKGGYVIQQVA
jgi:hypothetical protein